jgi:hypothetical protein
MTGKGANQRRNVVKRIRTSRAFTHVTERGVGKGAKQENNRHFSGPNGESNVLVEILFPFPQAAMSCSGNSHVDLPVDTTVTNKHTSPYDVTTRKTDKGIFTAMKASQMSP